MIDLDTIVARIADATAERLRPMVEAAVEAANANRESPRIYFAPELAKRLGKTSDAFRMWLKRGGREIASLAIDIGGRQAWRADDVDAYLSKAAR